MISNLFARAIGLGFFFIAATCAPASAHTDAPTQAVNGHQHFHCHHNNSCHSHSHDVSHH